MNHLHSAIFLLPALLLPGVLHAQDANAPKSPKLVPALGWDIAKQGGFTTCVTVDAQNTIWAGTEGNGLWSYDPRKKAWTQFTTKDGLGDDCIYALAVDKTGRIWAGHLNHGVSVWNGEKWKNYGVADGPLGSRVFAIATCPVDGDVWIATELGVARYSIADDDWDYFTRASGLPSNQIQAIAFDAGGNIYLGTQCDGIAMANAKEKYQKWVIAPGLPEMQNVQTGTGLASSLINDLAFVAQPQTAGGPGGGELLVAATPLGISVSGDYGDHFNFIRGEDWQDNVKGLLEVPDAPAPNQPATGPMRLGGFSGRPTVMRVPGIPSMIIINGIVRTGNNLQGTLPMEDWVTCLHAEKENGGRLWVGYRNKGLEMRGFGGASASVRFDADGSNSLEVRSIWTGAKTPALIAVYDEKDGGLKTPSDPAVNLDAGDAPPQTAPALPLPAKAPTADEIEPLTKRLGVFKNQLNAGDAVFIGDDWSTGGDWVGRYGTSYAALNTQDIFSSEPGFSTTVELGPHHNEGDDVNDHEEEEEVPPGAAPVPENKPNDPEVDAKADRRHVLYYPKLGARNEREINDRSWQDNYPRTWEGPDLWVTVEVPKGIHLLGLYFQNYDAHSGSDNKLRDYDIQILQPLESKKLTLKETPLARARVDDFWGGVYKQFAVSGPAKYVVHIKRNRSYVTKLLGLFIDRATPDPAVKKEPLPGFGNVKYAAPEPPGKLDTANNAALSAAVDLWNGLVASSDKRGAITLEPALSLWAYRAAVAGKAPDSLLASWRWQLDIWTQQDRDAFDKAMAEAYKAYSGGKPPDNGQVEDGSD